MDEVSFLLVCISNTANYPGFKHGEFHLRFIFGCLSGMTDKGLHITSGYPGCEFQIREALAGVIGKEKSELFFDKVRSSPLVLPVIYLIPYAI
jgi:hypothetical protein